MKVLITIRAVLWSFFGVRQGEEFQKDIQSLTPLHVMAVGLVACFVFVIGLMLFVRWLVTVS